MIKKITLSRMMILVGVLFLDGCTLPIQATKIGVNKFTLSSLNRSVVYSQATTFCSQKNLSLKPIRERTVQNNIVLDFKCLSEDSKLYKNDNPYEVTDNVIINGDMSSK